ncbi:MAG: L-serine ammonia-lyase, iron-sulfur-dependent, subunit alpha [Oscillospiraceae bacterium]
MCRRDDPQAGYRGWIRSGHGTARERGRGGLRRSAASHGGGRADASSAARQQCADAYAIALGNLLGLVCDPVAASSVPCVKRNVIGAVNAVSAANMAVAGITSRIPVDEVIDAMGEVGDALPVSLRETGLGGLAATPTGRQEAERIARAEH